VAKLKAAVLMARRPPSRNASVLNHIKGIRAAVTRRQRAMLFASNFAIDRYRPRSVITLARGPLQKFW
jgi:hypothetical protein